VIGSSRGLPAFAILLLSVLSFAPDAYAVQGGATELLKAPGISVRVTDGAGAPQEVATALRMVLGLTILSLAPAILVCMTSFVRISIVLSLLRHAIGLQETPSNTVLVSLALFLTLFSMAPVLDSINTQAFQPFMDGRLDPQKAMNVGIKPLREFMLRQTRDEDLVLMAEVAKRPMPSSVDELSMLQIIPAFMISELRIAFQIGFVIFVPFLLVDLLVATALMALGMMMVPPTSIALPLKILLFVLAGGWQLVIRALMGTIH
jgi:flagellar biosynthetic protein FliP